MFPKGLPPRSFLLLLFALASAAAIAAGSEGWRAPPERAGPAVPSRIVDEEARRRSVLALLARHGISAIANMRQRGESFTAEGEDRAGNRVFVVIDGTAQKIIGLRVIEHAAAPRRPESAAPGRR